MELEKKYYFVSLINGFVVCFANFLVVFLLSNFPTAAEFNNNVNNFKEFQNSLSFYNFLKSFLSFSIPTIFCLIYTIFWHSKHKACKIINYPIVYSYLGITGWIMNFFVEIPTFFIARKNIDFALDEVIFSSFIKMILSSFFTFIISFFAIKTLNRRIFLPKLFPNGHLKEFKHTMNFSIRKLNRIYFFAVCTLPSIYLFSLIFSIYFEYPDKKLLKSIIFFAIIFILCFCIHIVFTDYFHTPIKKLTDNIVKISNGDYSNKVDFVSNDDFGILTDAFNDMTQTLQNKTEKILAIQNSIIKGMAAMVESRDNSTGGHINRTSDCVQIFTHHLFLENVYPEVSETFYKNVAKAAPMHDLGKIAVDDKILKKEGKFTDEEYNKMKAHSEEGARIVKFVLKESNDEEFKKIAENVAHFHHEKWNGLGYPKKLKGLEIPFEARIMALADVFDALVSKRCYKEKFSFDRAFQIIEDSLGTHFDEKLGKEFLKCRPILEEYYLLLG